ncbi:hypothetical protein HZS55_12890 [Halosimplex rubrum]|uniref:Uncharacterized protein n=1 Tax=Halosimplex rubrum TaxID=869889 RepID=A0A7D5P4P0_9EURY|nr:hypothetical protein [Halosimplex rubrum]QLH78144.1 hypothetical protein HZS55_12890 [Halosimplex rubrum]
MTSDDNFELRDGQYHCTNPDCDWWVPEGMEYLADDHDCEEWRENTDEEDPDFFEGLDVSSFLDQNPQGDELEAMFEGCVEEGEMTDLEREVIEERMEDIEDEEKRGDIDELIERLEDPIFADEPEVELDAENDDLSDIPTQEEIEERLEELKEEVEEEESLWDEVDVDELLEETTGESEAEEMVDRNREDEDKSA